MASSNIKLLEKLLNAIFFIVLLVVFYVYYFQVVFKQWQAGITNTAKYEKKLTGNFFYQVYKYVISFLKVS